MKTHKPRRGLGPQLLGWIILLAAAYISARLLLWLFPAELHRLWKWF